MQFDNYFVGNIIGSYHVKYKNQLDSNPKNAQGSFMYAPNQWEAKLAGRMQKLSLHECRNLINFDI